MEKTLKILNQLEKKAIVRRLFRAKEEWHQQLARLPLEEKLQILIRLQEMAAGLGSRRGRRGKFVWKIQR